MKLFLIVSLLCFQLNIAFSQTVLTNASNGYISGYTSWLYYNWGGNPGYYPASSNYTHPLGEIWDLRNMTTYIGERLDYTICSFDSTKVRTPFGEYAISTEDYIIVPDDYTFTYNVPDTLMKFPLHLGDHFATSYYAINPISTSTYYRTVYGSDTTVVDAHGKLILPHGTYDDVLRLKTISNFTDTCHCTPDTIFKTHSVRYRWYSPTQREYLMVIDTSYILNTIFSSSYEKRIMSGFVLMFPLAVNDLLNFDDVKIYPNPASTDLTISSSDKISSVAITNLLGQTVYTFEYNTSLVQIEVADLPKGMYFLRINGIEVRKFIKE